VFVVLVGPKGSGKSHIGRVLEQKLGVHFFHFEPLWIAYYSQCKAAGHEPTVPGGISVVHPKIKEAIRTHEHVCIETTGASPEILADLLSLASARDTLVARINVPLELCLERINSRDQTHQIPMDVETVKRVYRLSTAANVHSALILDNTALSEAEIVALFENALTPR